MAAANGGAPHAGQQPDADTAVGSLDQTATASSLLQIMRWVVPHRTAQHPALQRSSGMATVFCFAAQRSVWLLKGLLPWLSGSPLAT